MGAWKKHVKGTLLVLSVYTVNEFYGALYLWVYVPFYIYVYVCIYLVYVAIKYISL